MRNYNFWFEFYNYKNSKVLNFFLILIFFMFSFCQKKNKQIFKTTIPVKIEDYNFKINKEFNSGFYKVLITSYCINDTLSEDEVWESIQWPIVIKQKITFKYKDTICSVFNFPSKTIDRKTKNDELVKAAEIVLWDATLFQTKDKVFLGFFEATALCTGSYCPTFDGVFNLNGSLVYQIYKDENKQRTLVFGDVKKPKKIILTNKNTYKFDSIVKSYDITNEAIQEAYKKSKKIKLLNPNQQ